MDNCLFAFPDRLLPNAYVTPILAGGSWLEALPLANLQDSSDSRMSTLARSADALPASTLIDIDLGAMRDLRVLAILRHNLSLTATVRFRFWTDTARTQLAYDTGVLPVWLPFYPAGSLPWGHPSLWDGKILEEDRDGYQFDFIRALPAQVVARSVRVEISDPDNPDGYIELSRCPLAPAWQPPVNFTYGNTVGWESDATISKSLGGRRFIDEQAKRRTAACTIEHLDPGIAMSSVMEMQRRLGKSGELVYIHDPTVTSQAEWQRSFLANMDELSPIENPYFNANTAGFKLLEVL